MLKNYLNSAIRHFLRHRFFSFLNIAGLTVGIACSLLLAMFVWQEATYDNFHADKDRIYRITSDFKMGEYSTQTAMTGSAIGPAITSEIPEVANMVRFFKYPVVVTHEENKFEEADFIWADSSFFDVFSFRLLEGNPKTALSGRNKILLTPESALKYFGDKDPVGEMLVVDNGSEYEVTGIVEAAPVNSQIKYDFIASFTTLRAGREPSLFPMNYYSYIMVNPNTDLAVLESKVSSLAANKASENGITGENYLKIQLEPLTEVHLTSDLPGLVPNVDKRYVVIFFIVTVLILVIACINYMNLATARAADRGTEVGVRKVMGAHRGQLFWQYITESFISVLVAFVFSIVLASLVLPYFNTALNKQYSLDIFLSPLPLTIIFTVVVLVALGSGIYPALVLTHFSPVKTLKGSARTSKAGLGLRRGLIVFQFVISAGLIICSLVIYEQIRFIQTSDIGYQKEHVVAQTVDNDVVRSYSALKSQLSSVPAVEEMTLVYETPTHINWGDGMETNDGRQLLLNANPVEYNYLNTFRISLLAGEDFTRQDQLQADSDSAQALNEAGRNIIINKRAAQELGWTPEEAVGQRIDFKGNATIIGVTENFHYAPLHEEVGPLFLFVDRMYNQVVFRLSGSDIPGTLSLIEEEWNRIAPHIPFDPLFLDEEYNAMYENEERLGMLFGFFTILAVILGTLGLLGLSALMISNRTREIGIRKVLGASVNQIVGVLSIDFMKLVLVACMISIPLAWYAMDQWLQTFSAHISMPWYLFILAGTLLLLVSLLTLSTQTVRAALRNPTEVIRNE